MPKTDIIPPLVNATFRGGPRDGEVSKVEPTLLLLSLLSYSGCYRYKGTEKSRKGTKEVWEWKADDSELATAKT